MPIYFIQAENFVKIGFAADVVSRFVSIRCGNHVEVRLLSVIDGGLKAESDLHFRFADYRVHGEWFRLEGDLRTFVAGLPSFDQPSRRKRKWPVEVSLSRDIDHGMFDRRIRENLLAIAKAYSAAEGISLTTTSKRAYGHSKFLSEFAAGRKSLSIQKCEQVLNWFEANWPEGAAWPHLRPVFMFKKDC